MQCDSTYGQDVVAELFGMGLYHGDILPARKIRTGQVPTKLGADPTIRRTRFSSVN